MEVTTVQDIEIAGSLHKDHKIDNAVGWLYKDSFLRPLPYSKRRICATSRNNYKHTRLALRVATNNNTKITHLQIEKVAVIRHYPHVSKFSGNGP
jgi:hypothetical protein